MPLRFFPHRRHITSGEAVLTFEAGTTASASHKADTPHAYLRACRLHSALYTQPPVYLTWDILTQHEGHEHARPPHKAATASRADVSKTSTTVTTIATSSSYGTARAFAPYMHHTHTRHAMATAAVSQPVRIRLPSHAYAQHKGEAIQCKERTRQQELCDEAMATIAQPHYQTHRAIPSCASPALHSPRPVPHIECTTLAYILPFAQDMTCATVHAAASSSYDIDALLLFDADYTLYMKQQHQNNKVQAVRTTNNEDEEEEIKTEMDECSAEITANDKEHTLVPLRRRHSPPPASSHSLCEDILAEWADMQQRALQLRKERHATLQTRTEELRRACSDLLTKRNSNNSSSSSVITNSTTQQTPQPLFVTSYPSQASPAVHEDTTVASLALPGQDASVTFDELRYFAHRAWQTWCGRTSSEEDEHTDKTVVSDTTFSVLTPPLCALEEGHTSPRCIHRHAHYITCNTTPPMEKQCSHVAQDLLRQALRSSSLVQGRRPSVSKVPCPTPPPASLLLLLLQPAHTSTASPAQIIMPPCMAAQPPFCVAYNDEADMQRRWWCCHTLAAAAAADEQQRSMCEVNLSQVVQYIWPHTSDLLWPSDVVAHTQSRTTRRALRNAYNRYKTQAQELLHIAMQQTPPLQIVYKSTVAHDGPGSESNSEVCTEVVQLRNFAASAVADVLRRHDAQAWRLWSSAMTAKAKDSKADEGSEAAVQRETIRIRAEREHRKEKKVVREQLLHDALSTLLTACSTRVTSDVTVRRHAALVRSREAAVAKLPPSLRVFTHIESTTWLHELLSVCIRREHRLRMHSFYYDLVQALCNDGQQQEQQEERWVRTECMTSSTPAWLRPGMMAQAVAEPCEQARMRDEAERWPGEAGLLPWCDDTDEEDEDRTAGSNSHENVQAAVVRSTRYMFADINVVAGDSTMTSRQHHNTGYDAANASCACEADVYASLRGLAADVLQCSQHVLRRRRGGGQGMGGARHAQPVFSLEAQLETHVHHLRTAWAQTLHNNATSDDDSVQRHTSTFTDNDEEETDELMAAWMQAVEAIYCRTLGVRDTEGRTAMQMHFAYMHAMLRTQQQALQAYYSSE